MTRTGRQLSRTVLAPVARFISIGPIRQRKRKRWRHEILPRLHIRHPTRRTAVDSDIQIHHFSDLGVVLMTDVAQELTLFLSKRKDAFEKAQDNAHNLKFEQECIFARQQILKNDFTLSIARSNQQSLHNAIMNVASIGISLNPANQDAYLIPRDKAIVLDIGFRGLCRIATDSGVIKWVQADIVREKDVFMLNGMDQQPTHERNPFGDRGEFIGVYCVAKTNEGDYLTTAMSAAEVYKIRDASQAAQKSKNSPWFTWFEEMAKKACIKRASKLWPASSGSERFNAAVTLLNEQDGNAPLPVADVRPTYTQEQKDRFDSLVQESKADDLYLMSREIPDGAWIDLYNSAEEGQKVKMKGKVDKLLKSSLDNSIRSVAELQERMDADDKHGAMEILADTHIDLLEPHALNELMSWIATIEQEAA